MTGPASPALARPGHWDTIATRWSHLGPPLRLSPEDVQAYVGAVADHLGERPLQVGLLGVTPELATAPWPPGSTVAALDRSSDMIAAVWPGDLEGVRRATCGEWLQPGALPAGLHAALCDGGFNLLAFPAEHARLAEVLAATLRPGGCLVARTFVAPDVPERVDAVVDAARAGRIGSFHAFKLRLAVALQRSPEEGVCVGDVHEAWLDLGWSPEAWSHATGWSVASVRTIELYEGRGTRMSFPTLAAWTDALAPALRVERVRIPTYELGERCPIVTLR